MMMGEMYRTPLKILQLEKGDFHTLLNGSVGGHRMRIVLDTGASHSCIDKQFVNQIFPDMDMEKNEGVNAGIGGMGFEVLVADLPDFRLGRYRQASFPNTAVIDFTHINNAYRMLHRKPVQMILGNDFCIKHKAVIDYERNQFIFHKS
ncbi:MAG: retropepsin-like domain-containing protein [Bacteroidales bacterium]|nr:retropepsin-like domain-containing protein [Bacteroidales bacterium]